MLLDRDGYPAGVPCWIDTSQPDPEAAARFYGELFGWELDDAHAGRTVPGHDERVTCSGGRSCPTGRGSRLDAVRALLGRLAELDAASP